MKKRYGKFAMIPVTYKGVTYHSVTDCVRAKYKNASWKLVRKCFCRLRLGYSIEDAMRGLDRDRRATLKPIKTPGRGINSRIVIDGKTVRLREVLARTGIEYSTYRKRMVRGWSKRDAATTPNRTRKLVNKSSCTFVTAFGETHSIKEWATIKGLSYTMLCTRLTTMGWTPEEALSVGNLRTTVGHYLHPVPKSRDRLLAEANGLSLNTVRLRQRKGRSFEEAVSYPPRASTERMVDKMADDKRRELASLGIII